MKISVNNHTTPLFTINLPVNATGNITVKINSEQHTLALSGGIATLKISNLICLFFLYD